MLELLNEIKQMSIKNRKSLEQIGLKLSEETGECSQALLSYLNADGCGYKDLDLDDVKEECVDVIMVALSLFYKLNGNDIELKDLLKVKTNKWEEKTKDTQNMVKYNSQLQKEVIKKILDIPNWRRIDRELYNLSIELNVEKLILKEILDKLVQDKLIEELIQYYCPVCSDTFIMSNDDLEEFADADEDGLFECESCMRDIDLEEHKTGFIYYDILDEEKLKGMLD